jgi:hydroxypyruvate isomerase
MRGDVSTALAALMPIIGHVQVASVPARHEPMTGELNDRFLFAELDRLGYAGFVGCEYRPAGATTDGLGWFDAPPAAFGRSA